MKEEPKRPESEIEVLAYLAREGGEKGATRYEIFDSLDFREGTIYESAVPNLEKKGRIERTGEGEFTKYRITLLGLLQHLRDYFFHRKKRGNDILSWLDALAENERCRELVPLVFGKWEKFKKHEDERIVRLVAFQLGSGFHFFPTEAAMSRPVPEENEEMILNHHIYSNVFDASVFCADDYPIDLRENWFELLLSDQDWKGELLRQSREKERFSRERALRDKVLLDAIEEENLEYFLIARGGAKAYSHPGLAERCELPLTEEGKSRLKERLGVDIGDNGDKE